MCRNRSNRCTNGNNNVLGDSGIQRIALRGPGCIDGTGQCEDVLGTGGRCCERFLGTGGRRCTEVLRNGGRQNDYVMGTGGRRCAEILGNGGRQNDYVMGTGGRRCAEVLGASERLRPYQCCEYCCNWLWNALETPTTVPR